MTGLVKMATGVFTGGASTWIPYAIVGVTIVGLGIAVWTQHSLLNAAHAQVQADKDAIATAQRERDISKADADRWIKYSADQTAEIDSLNKQLAQHVADAQAADAAAEDLRQRQAQQIAMLQTTLADLKEKARVHPEQTRPLGPIVLELLRSDAAARGAQASPASH